MRWQWQNTSRETGSQVRIRVIKRGISQILFACITALMAVSGSLLHASERWVTVDVSNQPFVISSGEVRTVTLPYYMNLYKLMIQAESTGQHNSVFDVIVNGDTKGTIVTPGADPTYIVTVADSTNSLQLRSISGGAFRILRILAVVSPADETRETINRLLPNRNAITALAANTILIERTMEPSATPDEQQLSLLPIKAAAGRLFAIASARGESSGQTRQAAVELIAAIDAARPYLDTQMKKDGEFNSVLELLTLRAKLDALIS